MLIPSVTRRFFPQIEKNVRGVVAHLAALQFLLGVAFTAAKITRDTVFLARLPASDLPYVSIALALLMFAGIKLIGRVTAGVSAARGLARIAILTGVALAAFAAWVPGGGVTVAMTMYLWTGVFGVLLMSQFWIVAGQAIEGGRARSVMAVIGASGILGGIAASAVLRVSTGWLLPHRVLIGIAGVHLVVGFLAEWHARAIEASVESRVTRADEPLSAALRLPYVRWIAVMFLAAGLCGGVLDYLFKRAIQQGAASPEALTSALATFYAAQNGLALVVQLGFSAALLTRLRVRTVSIALPAGVVLGAAAILAAPGITAIAATRLYESTLRLSVVRDAWEFLFFPLTESMRAPAKRLIDGVVNRMSEGLAGALLLAVNLASGGSVTPVVLLLLALAIAWLAVEIAMTPAYAQQLTSSLDQMLVPYEHGPQRLETSPPHGPSTPLPIIATEDPRSTRAALIEQLAAPQARRRVRAELVAHGDRGVGTLGDYLVDESQPVAIRREVPRILALIGTQAALHSLWRGSLLYDDVVLLQRVLWAMTRIRKERPEVEVPFTGLDKGLEADVRLYVQQVRCRSVIGTESSLLARVLLDRSGRSRQRAFRRLALLYQPEEMLRAHRGLIDANARARAQAMEYLDAVLSPRHKRITAPLLNETVAVDDLMFDDVLRELAAGEDPWLHACALFVIAENRLAHLSMLVDAVDGQAAGVLGETARWAQVRSKEAVRLMESEQSLTTLQRITFLLAFPHFEDIDSEELTPLASRMVELRFAAGDEIYHPGSVDGRAYVVVSGGVEEWAEGGSRRLVPPGTGFGLFSMLGIPEIWTARAMEATHVLAMSRADFIDAVIESPMIAIALVRNVGRDFQDALRRLDQTGGAA